MADGFEAWVPAAQGFFAELRENNTRDWFETQKSRYADEVRKPGELFAETMAAELTRLSGRPQTAKVFRIHRDIRFSKDKTPYKAYLHMLWSSGDGGPLWFFGLEPEGPRFGMGVFDLKGEPLNRYRAMIDREGDAIASEIDRLAKALGADISHFGAAPLKRVPKPYDQDHPHAALLRRKGLSLFSGLADDPGRDGLVARVGRTAEAYLPLWRILAEGL